MAVAAVIVAIACAGIYGALRPWKGEGPVETIVVEKKAPPPPSAPMPPRDLEWYEPDDSWNPNAGPREGWLAGKHLIVGLLWLRGERRNGLYAGAFDYDSLAKVWVAGPFESEWTGEEDERFHLAVSGESVIVIDSAGQDGGKEERGGPRRARHRPLAGDARGGLRRKTGRRRIRAEDREPPCPADRTRTCIESARIRRPP